MSTADKFKAWLHWMICLYLSKKSSLVQSHPRILSKNFSIFTFQFSVFIVSLPIEKHVFMDAAMIKIIQDYFKTQPVLKAWLFGSYARGEETPDSDVDILVVFDRKKHSIGLIDHVRMANSLEDLLKRKIDLVEEGTLLPFASESANHDKKLFYERAN